VRYISNLPSASDTKLCFTLWQLKWCRKSNDKTVYSNFQNISLVVFIEIWTDAFINNANVMIDRHYLLAEYSLSYMSIIRGAVVDAPFNRVYQCDQQFRLRIAYNQTRSFTLWQLKWCRKSNDKTVYSKFQNLSLVVFDINISVSLSHVSNIGSVLVTLFTIRSSSCIR
jgi:hypothetical protein